MPERRGDEPGRLLDDRTAVPTPHRRRCPLQMADGFAHREVMSRAHAAPQVIPAEPEEDAHALRCSRTRPAPSRIRRSLGLAGRAVNLGSDALQRRPFAALLLATST